MTAVHKRVMVMKIHASNFSGRGGNIRKWKYSSNGFSFEFIEYWLRSVFTILAA
jgi:hypothetical protein